MAQIDLGKIGFSFKGEYNPSTTYEIYDVVVDSGNKRLYLSLNDNNINNPLTDTTNWALWIDGGGVMPDVIKSTTNPTITENLSKGIMWINETSGEIFTCVDDTPDNNIWQGQLGTKVAPTTTNIVDFFGDNSCVALYQLDGNVNDTSGIFNGQPIGEQLDLKFSTNVAKFSFTQSLEIVGNQNRAFIIPQDDNLQVKSMSVWVKRLSTQSSSNAYLFDNRNKGGDALFIWNNGVTVSGISKYLVNGQSISLDSSYKDQWIHLYIEFSNIQNGMVVGFYNGLSGHYDFGGYVDQIRLFNRNLTNSEVQQLYNEE